MRPGTGYDGAARCQCRGPFVIRFGHCPAPLSRRRMGENLFVLAKLLHRGFPGRVKTASRTISGAAARPGGARFAAIPMSPTSDVSTRRLGVSPVVSRRASARPVINPLPSSTIDRKARPSRRVAVNAIPPGSVLQAGAFARTDAARRRALPTRVRNGQQNAYRRLPPRRDAGGGAAGE